METQTLKWTVTNTRLQYRKDAAGADVVSYKWIDMEFTDDNGTHVVSLPVELSYDSVKRIEELNNMADAAWKAAVEEAKKQTESQ